jgi:pimeloyl-ACP methyl ester carboxylesterase
LDGQQAKLCVSRIAREVLAVRPLADALKQPIRVLPMNDEGALSLPSGHAGRIEAVINDVAVRIGAPRFKIVSDAGDQSVFESVISNRLALGPDVIVDSDFGCRPGEVDELVAVAVGEDFDAQFSRAKVRSFDGAMLRSYRAGAPHCRAVVLVSACGMPAKLCERWMRFLGENHFVITWESRLLFEDLTAGQEWAYDVDAHVADLFAVMDHFGVQQAHLMGLCGGAVVAVAAAAKRRDRVRSLSLWHGDYELGSACPKTKHQKDLQALMAVVASSQLQADQIHQMFSHNILKNFRKDLAHIVLYPYANSQLLHRYGRSNGNIMQTNVSSLLSQVRQPSLVVTSDDDNTAHPAGSMFVAERLANAQLQMERHGDHLSLFDARSHVTEAASRFLETVGY